MNIVPKNNLIAYELIYLIEVGLREFLIYTFGKDDQKWWKQRLPPDVLDKLKQGREKERKIKWIELIPHHPLYYIDFPDLKRVIEVRENWHDAFQKILGDKDVYCGGLRELEPIRNNIAHNRRISETDLYLLRSNKSKLESAIGKEKWESLIIGQTVELGIYEKIVQFGEFLQIIYEKIKSFESIENLEFWNETKNQWWFDNDYLCQDLSPLDTFYAITSNYISLPRFRGSGYLIENWVRQNITLKLYQSVEETIHLLLAQKGN
jgi:hypothetical protein